jgi:ABC-2 type transport system ATP-binding protein
LGQLKGLSKKAARVKAIEWLEKFDILSWWKKDIAELSKGMGQKVQFIATVLHEPSLIILDEPFSGLDPINANLIKDEIYRLKEKGASILFSTHRMEQVEEICEDIVLIHKGNVILYGNVIDIKNQFKEHLYQVQYDNSPAHVTTSGTYKLVNHDNGRMIIQNNKDISTTEVLKELLANGFSITGFNEILPTLNEIFIKKVESASN